MHIHVLVWSPMNRPLVTITLIDLNIQLGIMGIYTDFAWWRLGFSYN